MGILKTAVRNANQSQAASEKKGTQWQVEGDRAKSMNSLIKINRSLARLKAQKTGPEGEIKDFATEMFIDHVADTGELPPTPVHINDEDGHHVTWVVQDRGDKCVISPERKQELFDLVGPEEGKQLLQTQISFELNDEVLNRRGAKKVVDRYLSMMQQELQDKGIVDDGEEVVKASITETFKPGTLRKLSDICGRSTSRIQSMIEILGSAMTHYVKT